MHTSSTWITVPEAIIAAFECERERVVDALRGLGRALHTVATLRMMCSGGDIGLAVDEPEDSGPRLYLYDNIPGGVGFSGRLFQIALPLLAAARELIAGCACEAGCPSCIGASRVVEQNARTLPVRLADALLGRPVEPLPRLRVIE